ncbi:MAG: FAD-dependent oxidoreductase, partial [Gammaproteobacteria bacterium]|nr:FAD-dependent oxidoreductase [Gammaproteobacteria bacterium]
VTIVGGGWAGLATAIELCQNGVPVTLIEAARQLGGRARCLAFDAERVDNGQHLMIGAYRETLRLLTLVHAPAPVRRRLQLRMHTSAAEFSLTAPNLPAPLHLISALLSARGINAQERRGALRFCVALAWRRFQLAQDISLVQLLARHRQSPRLIECLWEPLCLATLNTPLNEASAQVFLAVLRDAFARRRADSDVLFAATDLGQTFPAPALEFIEQHGGRVVLGERITELRIANDTIAAVVSAQQLHASQHVVLATPAYATARLLAPHAPLQIIARNLEQLNYEPICTVYLRYPAHVTLHTGMVGFTGTLTQWLVDRAHCDQPGLMAAVISARGTHMELSNDELIQRVRDEIAQRYPAWPTHYSSMVIREKRATFACRVGINTLRPANTTPVRGLWLAGDYTATGYPATLEGAVRSGVDCARQIRADLKSKPISN